MTKDPVRIGFLGTGFIATYHSKSLKRGGAHIVRAGAYDPDDNLHILFSDASENIYVHKQTYFASLFLT